MNLEASEYFSRMTTIPEIRSQGLKRLASSHVALIGAGGVGSAMALYLSRMGVGHLRIIDQDIVEPSNLHRLHGASPDHLYHPKAEVAAETLAKSNPWTRVEPFVDTLRPGNVDELLSGSELVVDGLDNFRSRYVVNRYSHESNIPYLFTSAIAQQGHLALFSPSETACLHCMAPRVVDRSEESCETLGITPTIVGLVGAIGANEASKVILGLQTKLKGRLLTIDMTTLEFALSPVSKRPNCELCSKSKTDISNESDLITELCGKSSFNVMPEIPLKLDLRRMHHSVPRDSILGVTDTVLVYKMGGTLVSLFYTGRLLIEGIKRRDDALQLAKRIWQQAREEVVRVAMT